MKKCMKHYQERNEKDQKMALIHLLRISFHPQRLQGVLIIIVS